MLCNTEYGFAIFIVVSLIGGDKFRKIFLNFNGEMNSK
jgi:hypothetical protein